MSQDTQVRSNNRIVDKMLERLFAAMANGPSLNCKPHSSRQRVDFSQFARFADLKPEAMFRLLLGEKRAVKVVGRVAAVQESAEPEPPYGQARTPEQVARSQARQAFSDQQALFTKLRGIVEDAHTYEQDTGVHVLQIGYPLLSLPGGSFGQGRRVLAPLAFFAVDLTICSGISPSVQIDVHGEGADLVVPNAALLAWLEQQTGQSPTELFADEDGKKPWKEILEIVGRICALLEIPIPPTFIPPPASLPEAAGPSAEAIDQVPEGLVLHPAPRADEGNTVPTILSSAILGLFPMNNQGLLRDTQAMARGELVEGPVESFLRADVRLLEAPVSAEADIVTPQPAFRQKRDFASERMVAGVDPCQARAVKLARSERGLVIHGPPGTGKSQTITNIIGDHLAHGQRVLFVCDKRTALDVVINRLQSLGLSELCALVHDPQRDQRDLYRAIRDQLDNLSETQTDARAHERLERVDSELQRLHGELSAHHVALMASADHHPSFHELVGQWLETPPTTEKLPQTDVQNLSVELLDSQAQAIGDLLARGQGAGYANNPWKQAAAVPLNELLSTPMERYRRIMAGLVQAGAAADATLDRSIPSFMPGIDLQLQGARRAELIEPMKEIALIDAATTVRWARRDSRAVTIARRKLSDLLPMQQILEAGPLDAELAPAVAHAQPTLPVINQQLLALNDFLAIAGKWYAFTKRSIKATARQVHAHYGIVLNVQNAQRLSLFLTGLRARLLLSALHHELSADAAPTNLPPDNVLEQSLRQHTVLFDTILRVENEPELQSLQLALNVALSNPPRMPDLIAGFERSTARALAVQKLERALLDSKLFNPEWLSEFEAGIRRGDESQPMIAVLDAKLDTLESVLRVREGLAHAPAEIQPALLHLLAQGVEPAIGMHMLRRAALAQQIETRLKKDPALHPVDEQRMRSSFDRYRQLDQQKKALVRDAIVHQWVTRQKAQLLSGTGTRLGSTGADLRRRLTLRGQRAMRLRQVINLGQQTGASDPLFDLRPVWMASPETVAQIFPRKAMFDVVIFDEASQCRLEEALPVLLRGQRVVVAGDPRQLPPTRFFESTLAASEEEEIESDQQLFEVQQGEIEDLLAAALNIEIQEAYLDVHYRSRNADLIQFSNEHFYKSRLQAIPAHPSNRARYSPVTLYQVPGIFEKHGNQVEAERVCRIVQDLLKRAEPPSIGIACFNLQQRDVIVESLEAAAAEDIAFANRLAEARQRRGAGSFEGLFVKNLENVQGDERDHIIISTTYGPDAHGKFYRRFGPLGRAGGGRRLNVLVTRARQEVHVVTSIPVSAYATLQQVPPGETPGGGWLLFAYLANAKRLADRYEQLHQYRELQEKVQPVVVNERPTRSPSQFASALARQLRDEHHVGSDVPWGNEGFCVDLALHHPNRPEDVSIGVLCDLTRYAQAEDPVEWEAFRSSILEGQGWELHRTWTPQFYRDPRGSLRAIVGHANVIVAREDAKEALIVPKSTEIDATDEPSKGP